MIAANGYTYRTSDGIYFDTSMQPDYGYIGRLDIEGQKAGARVDVGEKRNPTDFALWKFSTPDVRRQMEWASPWGVGFPGWHIECTAMAAKYLGEYFDIHCGGEDHITVHHPNEIAQSEACFNTRLANFWMHGYFLQLDDSKMSKSSGEFLRIQTLIDKGYDPLAYRFFCLGAHYRAKLTFSWDSLDAAVTALQRLRQASYEWGEPGDTVDPDYQARFLEHINNDLNMPRVLALVWEMVKSDLPPQVKKATLLDFDRVMGLELANWQPAVEVIPDEILAMVEQRQMARTEKRWKDADALRDAVTGAGYEIEDTAQGPRVRVKGSKA